MSIGYTLQKFLEALTVLTGSEDSEERYRSALAVLDEAPRRGVGVGFDDLELQQRFEQVLQRTSGAADISAIVSLALEAAKAQGEDEARTKGGV